MLCFPFTMPFFYRSSCTVDIFTSEENSVTQFPHKAMQYYRNTRVSVILRYTKCIQLKSKSIESQLKP